MASESPVRTGAAAGKVPGIDYLLSGDYRRPWTFSVNGEPAAVVRAVPMRVPAAAAVAMTAVLT